MAITFKDRVAIVTGAANGIGKRNIVGVCEKWCGGVAVGYG